MKKTFFFFCSLLYRQHFLLKNITPMVPIPVGVHVIFDAPEVVLDNGFICPIGASFEIRIGC